MAEKVFVEKKCYDVYEYVGHCPKCKTVQTNRHEHKVDILCQECTVSELTEIIENRSIDDAWCGSIIYAIEKFPRGLRLIIINKNLEVADIYTECSHIHDNKDISWLLNSRKCQLPEPLPNESITIRIWKKLIGKK